MGGGIEHPPEVEANVRVRELFRRALPLPASERLGFVTRECGPSAELARELERLLEHEARLGGFLLPHRPRPAASPRPARALLLSAGEVLGDYEIEAFIAGGGGGQVYRARQLSLGGRRVALKVVEAAGLSAGDRERFLRGAETAASLHHPGLVPVHACGEDRERGLVYFSMRLVEGPSLAHVLQRLAGRAPDARVRRALVQRALEVAEALGELHARGLVHRDVKPANVLVEGGGEAEPWSGRAILVDYGLLRSLASDARSTVLGTLPYAAPELFLEGRVDERADVYGLGLCLYDLLGGRGPDERPSGAAELERLARRAPALEPDLEALVHRAIDPAPRRRYADGAALARDLAAFLAGEPVHARRLTRLELLRRRLRRQPERVLRWAGRTALLAGVVALAVLGPWGWWASTKARAIARAWHAGDLARLQAEARGLSRPARRLLLDAPVMASLADLSGPSVLASVAETLRTHGGAAALELAARYLSRDGLASHSDLLRFLRHGLDSGFRTDALRWTALLLHELPAETPGEVELVRRVSAPLIESLARGSLSGLDRLYAISAVGAGGDERARTALLACAERAAHSGDPQASEELRLVLRALQLAAYRCRAAGFADAFCDGDWERDLERLRAATLRVGAGAWRLEFVDLASTVALRRAQAGLAPLPIRLAPDSLAFRVANRDPHFTAALAEPSTVFALLAESADGGRDVVAQVGRALGLLGLTLGPTAAENCLLRLPDPNVSINLGVLSDCIESGLAELAGIPGGWRPDPDTALGTWLDERRSDWVAVSTVTSMRRNIDARSRALWLIGADGVWLHGRALGLEQRSAPVMADHVPEGFARLGHGGISELRLRFAVDPALAPCESSTTCQRSPPVLSVAKHCICSHSRRFARGLMNGSG